MTAPPEKTGRRGRTVTLGLAALLLAPAALAQQAAPAAHPFVTLDAKERLVYRPAASGDRIIDFSHAGYAGGGVPIPTPAATIVVPPQTGDAREAIQTAIDLVSARSPGPSGIRGVVLLQPGTYRIEGQLKIDTGGVVLRGSGMGPGGTQLIATGQDRRALIDVRGAGTIQEEQGKRAAVVSARAPVGSLTLTIASADGLRIGDPIVVYRPSTTEWIDRLGMNRFEGWRPENRLHWQPGTRDILWERRITGIDDNRLHLDAPLTTALEPADGAYVAPYRFPGRIADVGVENLALVSEVDPTRPKDEDHAWFAISLDTVEDAWVRNVTARQFASYGVNIGPQARRITVQDVSAADPVSEIGGFRRRVFYTAGQQTLFNRCRSRHGAHDMAMGHAAAGPNVFLDCVTEESLDDSGPLESWSSGSLFDRVRIGGNALRLTDRGTGGQGAGWTAANSVLWNCEATDVEAANPPGAWNIAAGCKGTASGDGIVVDPRAVPYRDFFRALSVAPDSLYRAQLKERRGARALAVLDPAVIPVDPTGVPRLTQRHIADRRERLAAAAGEPMPPLRIEDGRFMIGDRPAWAGQRSFAWFQGQMPPALAESFGPAITRFAPGRIGPGLTDELEDVVDGMSFGEAFTHHYGLWYDRRRVNHDYDGSAERRSGEVWGPLLEQPWSRSGEGRAWDGLSKYDLTRFNPWFFDRVDEFARLADERGRILYYNFYFQHNLLESRSHYADFPWRPVNTVQPTGMPDEVPAASAFYDVSDPVRRDLHRRYIRHSLDQLRGSSNVVYGIDREYTGPISFVNFWLDTIAEWSGEHGEQPFVSLEVPKDQLDAILADPVRAPLISAMDVHHWVYRPDASLFAVDGDVDLAPRQQFGAIVRPQDIAALRARHPELPADPEALSATPEYQAMRSDLWRSTEAMRYRAWREYRDRHPRLVQLTPQDHFPRLTAAVERAVPAAMRAGLEPTNAVLAGAESAWASRHPRSGVWLVYSTTGGVPELDPAQVQGRFQLRWIPAVGEEIVSQWNSGAALLPPPGVRAPWAAWLTPVSECLVVQVHQELGSKC
ncbi:DUF6298 domain-containing protein [Altericroceibacterium xinjiangense]|uniref:DUF6298 domain-containing protein n=1 Tax=Altericroceibacterium xinjiangense TaxID=762261 RepID=UPI000F7F89FD|nr:DUF6298 domain-containing protein [Altericroceibacterium xinjiangense]